MALAIVPTQEDVLDALRTVLLAALPDGREVVLGQANNVPEPLSPNYVVMTPLRRDRLATNIHDLDDCRMVGSVSGAVLTVQTVGFGAVTTGRHLFGPGVTPETKIGAQISGPTGGAGTYAVSPAQTVAPAVLAAGVLDVIGDYQFDVQLDFHGGGASGSPGDDAETVSVLFRDDWATERFAAINPNIQILHADDPRFLPGFVSGEDQYEDRWVVEAKLQVRQTVAVPQEYADRVAAGLIDVDVEYPA